MFYIKPPLRWYLGTLAPPPPVAAAVGVGSTHVKLGMLAVGAYAAAIVLTSTSPVCYGWKLLKGMEETSLESRGSMHDSVLEPEGVRSEGTAERERSACTLHVQENQLASISPAQPPEKRSLRAKPVRWVEGTEIQAGYECYITIEDFLSSRDKCRVTARAPHDVELLQGSKSVEMSSFPQPHHFIVELLFLYY
ncbi:hypothetical protein B0H14DRAFT_2572788 [Mycena olivaceomarginata]|nr:hypothetical protein B0H14DRAFT_2572788 [Mycena olivaceomarginata]